MSNRKYNLKKDDLKKVFDLKTNEYCYSLNYVTHLVPLPYENLDIKTKIALLRENKKLLKDKDLLFMEQQKAQEKINRINKAKERNNYLKSIGFSCDSFVCYNHENGSVSDNLNAYLEELLNEEHVLIGIHRVGYYFNDEIKQDIFENGLILSGHLSSGGLIQDTHIRYNVSYYPDNHEILSQLMYAGGYKDSKGSILIRIPDSELEKLDDLYISDGIQPRLNPKYIVGYVPVYENSHIENIEMNPNFVKEKETYLK